MRWPAMMAIGTIVLGSGATLGCGPSLRRVQQSRIYFERCYAADFDPRIPLPEKHACWNAWMEHYTLGQAQDRTTYARDRIYAIEHGESVPRLPGLPEAALGPRQATPVTVSSGPSVDVEPERAGVADEEVRPRRRTRRYPRPLPRTSNGACASVACETQWRACLDTCNDDGLPCRTACEVELQSCSRGCF